VHWDIERQCYEFSTVPSLHHSESHISYDSATRNESRLVLDVHSHGRGHAFFSDDDDASDLYGVYFATVLGRCDAPEPIEVRTRLVIDGLHIPLQWHPWEAGREVADSAGQAMLSAESTEHRR
jgi:PRTRC genetic system protein A